MSYFRIGGLASGIDTEQMVKDLMKAHRVPLDRLRQDRQLLDWQRADYRAVNRALYDFRTGSAFNMKLNSTYLARAASSSNSGVVSASAASGASRGTYNITVTSLATSAYKASDEAISANPSDTIDPNATLWSQKDKFATALTESTFSFDLTTYGDGGTARTVTFEVDAETESLNDILKRVSSDQTLGLTAFYEASTDKVSISRTATGNFNAAGDEINVGTGFLADVLKLGAAVEQGGTDADITINGLEHIKQHSNTFTLNDVTFSLKGEGSATVTVDTDTDGIVESIKGFVDSYNALIDTLRSELQEAKYPDYRPLTDEQMEELTDRQIDQWEEKARSGLLQNDRLLESALRDIRTALYSTVSGLSGDYDHLSDIGIKTISYEAGGKLQVDEEKLRAAIEADPDGVRELFTTSGDTDETSGVAARLYDTIQHSLDRLTGQAGSFASISEYDNSYMGKTIDALDERIAKMEDHLQYLEDRYWQQFTAMEQAIAQMNAQSAWLSQQFAQ